VATASADCVVPDDPDDDFIVQTTIDGKAAALCTRDSHRLSPVVVEHCHRILAPDNSQDGHPHQQPRRTLHCATVIALGI
jgi:predicted nucleic acid-binding protein